MKLSMKLDYFSVPPLFRYLWSLLIWALQKRKVSLHKQMIKMMKFRLVIVPNHPPPPTSILSWLDVCSQALGRALGWSSCGPRGFKCDLMFHSVSALLRLGSLSFWSWLFTVASTTAVGQWTSVSHSSNLLASVLGCCMCFQPSFFSAGVQNTLMPTLSGTSRCLCTRHCTARCCIRDILWTEPTIRVNKSEN